MQPVLYGFRLHTGSLEEGLERVGLYMLKCPACLAGPRDKSQIAHIHQGFSFLFLPKLRWGNQQGLTGRTQIEINGVSQPPYSADLQWVWKVAEKTTGKENSGLTVNIILYWAETWLSCRFQILRTFLNHLVAVFG